MWFSLPGIPATETIEQLRTAKPLELNIDFLYRPDAPRAEGSR